MRPFILSVLLTAALLFTACSPASPAPGRLEDFSSACDPPNEGQLIAVQGYLRLPDSFSDTNAVDLRLYPDPTFAGKPIEVTMPFGEGPNQATRISGAFRDEDLIVHLANGQLAPFGTRLRVSGRMVLPVDPAGFACALEHIYLEAAK